MKRITAAPVAALAVAISFGAAACTDDGPEPGTGSPAPATGDTTSTPGTDETETTAPTETTTASTEPAATSVPAGEPTVESATGVVVGLTEDDAAAAAEGQGWELRVVRRDGEELPRTMDLRPNRVNVEVTDGEVTAVVDIG